MNIIKSAIHCLMHCNDVKHISAMIYNEIWDVLKIFLKSVICDAVTYIEHAKCKIITFLDVVYAFKRQEHKLLCILKYFKTHV